MNIITPQTIEEKGHPWRCMIEVAELTFKHKRTKLVANFNWDWTSCPEFANAESMTQEERDVLFDELFTKFKEQFSIVNTPYVIKGKDYEYLITASNFVSLEFRRFNCLR